MQKFELVNLYFLKTGSKLTLYMKRATLVWCPVCIRSAFSNCYISVLRRNRWSILHRSCSCFRLWHGAPSISCVTVHVARLVGCEEKPSNLIPEIHTGLICNQWCTSGALFTVEASLPDPPVTQRRGCNHLSPTLPLKEHLRHIVTRGQRWPHHLVLINLCTLTCSVAVLMYAGCGN